MSLRWSVLLCAIALAAVAWALGDEWLAPIRWTGGLPSNDTSKKPLQGMATRAQMVKGDAVICLPRLRPGIAATLVRTSMAPNDEGKVRLEPYPSWKEQTEGDCSCLQSAVDIFLDPMGFLWVLDPGVTNLMHPQPSQHCPPKVVAYDVNTKQIHAKISLEGLVDPKRSSLQFLVADYSPEGDCFLYLSDAGTSTIIVYNVFGNKGYRVSLPPQVLGSNTVPRGVLYMALVRRESGDNHLFLNYKSGQAVFSIRCKDLQENPGNGTAIAKAVEVAKTTEHMILLGTDDWDTIYFRNEDKSDVYKWNSSTPFEVKDLRLVYRGQPGLLSTHAITDYSKGIMRILESNLVEYLSDGAHHKDAINSLTVMQLT